MINGEICAICGRSSEPHKVGQNIDIIGLATGAFISG